MDRVGLLRRDECCLHCCEVSKRCSISMSTSLGGRGFREGTLLAHLFDLVGVRAAPTAVRELVHRAAPDAAAQRFVEEGPRAPTDRAVEAGRRRRRVEVGSVSSALACTAGRARPSERRCRRAQEMLETLFGEVWP